MCARVRLSQEERKEEILKAGMKVFKKKGYVNTTMEDIIGETTLSKGGVYYYYKSTSEILHDLMEFGIQYRMDIVRSTIDNFEKDSVDFLAEKIFEKIIDNNPYMDIYVQFLLAKRRDSKLESLFEELKIEARDEFRKEMGDSPNSFEVEELYDFLTYFMNSLIIGAEVLGARKSFLDNKDMLIEMLKTILS